MGISERFTRELLPPSQYDILNGSYPTVWHVNEKASFNGASLNYGIWFDHAIKVKKEKMLSAERLLKFIMHRAMVLYLNNKGGIIIVSPVCNAQKHSPIVV